MPSGLSFRERESSGDVEDDDGLSVGSSRSDGPKQLEEASVPHDYRANPDAVRLEGKTIATPQAASVDCSRRASLAAYSETPASKLTVHQQVKSAQMRLKQVTEANRALHAVVVKKRIFAEGLQEKSDAIGERINHATEVEIKARGTAIQEVERAIQAEQKRQQSTNLELSRVIMETEERLIDLTNLNAELKAANAKSRQILKEQSAELPEQRRANQELMRHMRLMEAERDKANRTTFVAQNSLDMNPMVFAASSLGSIIASSTVRTGASAAVAMLARPQSESQDKVKKEPKTIDDYWKLPGLDLGCLLGNEAVQLPALSPPQSAKATPRSSPRPSPRKAGTTGFKVDVALQEIGD